MNITRENGDTFVNGILINEEIANKELFEYDVVYREDFIDNLINWISECRNSDKEVMKQDLKYLMTLKDEYIFSSISTNEYISEEDSNFVETCKELLELNSFVNEVIELMELHNADEIGINNQWTFDDAEYFLLLSDKYRTK